MRTKLFLLLSLVLFVNGEVGGDNCDSELNTEGWDDTVESPLGSPIYMALRAQVLLYGRVLRTFPDRRFPHTQAGGVYTAELQVYCVLKGPKSNAVVNISEAG